MLSLVAMPLTQILEKYREEASSKREQGTKFEKLIRRFFLTDGRYEPLLDKVWLWSDFPCRKEFGSGQDVGIDLVAKTVGGEYWAIQCKCYKEDHTFNMEDLGTFLTTSGKEFTVDNSTKPVRFSQRVWVSTTRGFGRNFKDAIDGQNPPVMILGLNDLEESGVDWDKLEDGQHGKAARRAPKTLFDFQQEALDKAISHFRENDRGKLIMACGTGKTFTALKIAEAQIAETKAENGGLVLCLVPSIALVGQMLREWAANAKNDINAICVCSDTSVAKRRVADSEDDGGIDERVEELALPASTDPYKTATRIMDFSKKTGMTVVFSTYHSIGVISSAQKLLKGKITGDGIFDLVICDEAHRTTGYTFANKEESAFVSVHNNEFLVAKKRLYMTATPRIYGRKVSERAEEDGVLLCSMDNVGQYGREIYRLGFSAAVEKDQLSDYKVLVLTVREDQVSPAFIKALSIDGEIPIDYVGKVMGCINALSKRTLLEEEVLMSSDPGPMRRAVAFCRTIEDSQETVALFTKCQKSYFEFCEDKDKVEALVGLELKHIDGTMSALDRDASLSWLKSDSELSMDGHRTCRILSNVRCLSEGVDVPALDAVLFLSPKRSQIDVVQSVGRVMRKAPGKKYGYVIIPVVVEAGMRPEEVLDRNERYSVVWQVLNALRAHDDSFDAMVEDIRLTGKTEKRHRKIIFDTISDGFSREEGYFEDTRERFQQELDLQYANELQMGLYAKMVEKVGNRKYWENWARDIGDIAYKHVDRINKLIEKGGEPSRAFKEFHAGLCRNINPELKKEEVIEMLSQHIISRPVFEALFGNGNFTENNVISKAMSKMLDVLETGTSDEEKEERKKLERFYASVRRRVEEMGNTPVGRQKIIIELYDKFFKTTSEKAVDKLGIVYTPTEIVDFLIHSVESVLKNEFKSSFADENVHVLDPFTGTGTFITRLLQSGLIPQKNLLEKYKNKIHANEIVLLAYYIACVNIENAFAEVSGTESYESFPGACLTDTFQLGESGYDALVSQVFPENSERVVAQKKTPIRVIIGNPPYSAGAKTATEEDAQNQHYKALEGRIEKTYASRSSAIRLAALYDSYIKAFRWASDRIEPENEGVIAFITNSGWLRANAADGFRKCIEEEFSKIYVFDLRGNKRAPGALAKKKEGENVFQIMTPVAMTVLVKGKKSANEKAQIFYRDIGDYLSREEKLEIIKNAHDVSFRDGKTWEVLNPNEHGDWLYQRKKNFDNLTPLEPKKKFDRSSNSIFVTDSNGVTTSRDPWAYNFSQKQLCENMKRGIDFYNSEVKRFEEARLQNPGLEVKGFINLDPTKFKWDRAQKEGHVENGTRYEFSSTSVRTACYRPFQKQHLYFSRELNNCVYTIPSLFPTPDKENVVICVQKAGRDGGFCFITNFIPDYHLQSLGTKCFPLYYYTKGTTGKKQMMLNLYGEEEELKRNDGISDFAWKRAKELYGSSVSKEDIFYYVYGILHSLDYIEEFDANLKRDYPKVPFVGSEEDFWEFSKKGRELANLHLNYETLPLPDDIVATSSVNPPNYNLTKMSFPKGLSEKDRPKEIWYNKDTKIGPIPPEAYEYIVSDKSAINWVMRQYQVTTDNGKKGSLITNDPNLWCKENGDPQYIVNLVRRVIYISYKTVKIVKALPKIDFSKC